jgi:hypothetical protein
MNTSALFTGKKTPFHDTIASLIAAGGTVMPQSYASNWFSYGIGQERPYNDTPVYVGLSGQQTHAVSCSGCDASGLSMRLPATAQIQPNNNGNQDKHISSVDTVLAGEIDLFDCSSISSNATCANGGFLPFSGSGMVIDGPSKYSTGNAGGYARGIFQLTAGDILTAMQNHTFIPHALGMGVSCVGNSPYWPSTHGADNQTNALCEGAVVYGNWLFLNSGYVVPSGASAECAVILKTYQIMGAAVYDVSGRPWGSAVATENPITFASGSNPWYSLIEPDMAAHGEGSNPGQSFGFQSCLNWTTASDWRVLKLASGDNALP